jgi:hypothetical protein
MIIKINSTKSHFFVSLIFIFSELYYLLKISTCILGLAYSTYLIPLHGIFLLLGILSVQYYFGVS